MKQPLAIDLFCGLGGWTDGLLAEGYRVVGFDCERHRYPAPKHGNESAIKLLGNGSSDWKDRPRARYAHEPVECVDGEWVEYPAQLVLQDVLTIHGSQFASADLIVASPPCQEYSYMAMPWSIAKQKAAEYRDGTRNVADLTALFDACFRIQREACEAAGRYIPLVVENVCGAQKWVGRARWHFGSFYLWGDVPALMPITRKAVKVGGLDWKHPDDPRHRKGQAFNPAAQGREVREGRATKNDGGSWFNVAHNTTSGKGNNPVLALERIHYEDALKDDGVKGDDGGYERYHPQAFGWKKPRTSSRSSARKAASAHTAKIPLPLARHIARCWHPEHA